MDAALVIKGDAGREGQAARCGLDAIAGGQGSRRRIDAARRLECGLAGAIRGAHGIAPAKTRGADKSERDPSNGRPKRNGLHLQCLGAMPQICNAAQRSSFPPSMRRPCAERFRPTAGDAMLPQH